MYITVDSVPGMEEGVGSGEVNQNVKASLPGDVRGWGRYCEWEKGRGRTKECNGG